MIDEQPVRPPDLSVADPGPKPAASATDAPRAMDRWLAALAYLGPLCAVAMLWRNKSGFLHWHAQQSFVVFFLEATLLAVLLIVDYTVGLVPVLGLVVMVLLRLAVFVGVLVICLVGFVKALAGEWFRIPVIEEYAHHVPVAD